MDLVATLREAGCEVEDHRVPGARGRFDPVGVLWHHTASDPRADPISSIALYTRGRQGLPGPVVQLLLGRDAKFRAISDGRCNHAGRCSKKVINEIKGGAAPVRSAAARNLRDTTVGNRWLIGIEVENDGIGEDLRPGVWEALLCATAAICRAQGWAAGHVAGHLHITRRKIDPSWPSLPSWVEARAQIQAEIRRQANPPLEFVDFSPRPEAKLRPDGLVEGWAVTAEGRVQAQHGTRHYGDLKGLGIVPDEPIVAICGTRHGYWLIAADLGVFAFGDAPVPSTHAEVMEIIRAAGGLASPVVSASRTDELLIPFAGDGGQFPLPISQRR